MVLQQVPQPLAVIGNDISAAISIAANSTASGLCTSLGGAGSYIVQLTGTWVATLQVQVTYNGTTWAGVNNCAAVQNLISDSPVVLGQITAAGVYIVNVPGAQGVRVATTAYTSGTVTGTAVLTESVLPSAAGTYSEYSGSIGATKTAVKTTPGTLYGWEIFNSNSTPAYLQIFYQAVASVTLGTTAPTLSIGIGPVASRSLLIPAGIPSGTAWTVACTTTRTGSTSPTNTVDLNIFYL